MKNILKIGHWAVAGFACVMLACVTAGCAEGPTPTDSPKAAVRTENTPPTPSTGAQDHGEHPAKAHKDARPGVLTPATESNPCRATALVLEQLLEKSTRDFAQQSCSATKTR